MNSLTRSALANFSRVSLPSTCVLTGPSAGMSSLNAWAWNCTIASVSMGCAVPQAPLNGLVRSSYEKPRSSKPLEYCFSQSPRLALSASNNAISSLEIGPSSLGSTTSAKLASNGTSSWSFSPISTVAPPSSSKIISMSPSGVFISISGSSISIVSSSSGRFFSIAMVFPKYIFDLVGHFYLLSHLLQISRLLLQPD